MGPRPLWRGRGLALVGIVLVAANLRTAVTSLSPIFAEIDGDIGVGSVGLGLLGMLPPLCFALFGVFTPRLVRRLHLEPVLLIALGSIVVGHLVRSLAPHFAVLAIGSALCFAGIGIGNVVLPPLVKKYFPDRVGLVTSLYATVLSVSTFLPPLVAVPVAEAAGWHVSLGVWSIVAMLAVVPWIGLIVRERRDARAAAATDPEIEESRGRVLVHRSPIAWAIAAVFATSSLNAYAMFTWLPTIVTDVAGVTPAQGGLLLSLFSAMGVPASLIVPMLVARLRNVAVLVYVASACFVLGYLGLLLWPATLTWLWVLLAGLGPLLFPLALVLINLRTASHDGAVALSGFVQSVGYTLGALGPLVVSLLHAVTGSWTVPLVLLLATGALCAVAGRITGRPTTIEADLAARGHGRA
ncbi:ABC transporter permease [Plantibacter sp. Leaf171]|uniref:MFS transporter n=1 Tax=unclassified Plantibacter TaxID=2624265 RepID=UPI0007009D76|nr:MULTISPECIES: MFS transporter [unclassified Plantibacter]KQM14315.1 ABC transporter permease [Plantibacter sp. Leaf1]KQR57697.1 ABC transporter permease [Plantibacter sp. Leaf171]